MFWNVRRFCKTGFNAQRSTIRSVLARYEQYQGMLPIPIKWEQVDAVAAIATMEATTALLNTQNRFSLVHVYLDSLHGSHMDIHMSLLP